MSNVKTKTVREIIQEQMADEQREIDLTGSILPVLEKFEGRQVNKRIETAIKNHFDQLYENPGDRPLVSMQSDSWKTELYIWGGGNNIKYGNIVYFVCHKSNQIFTMKEFQDSNARYFRTAQERQNKRKETLPPSCRKNLRPKSSLIDKWKRH
jgi:hypothetical protein